MAKTVRAILWTVMALAAVNLVLPFVGPAIGFGMGSDPAFTITSGRIYRHVLPDLIVIGGAWLMLSGGTESSKLWGGLAAILAGGWVAVGPHVLGVESVSQFLRRITYHSLTGIVLAGLAGVALGMLIASRVSAHGEMAATGEKTETVGV